MRANRRPRNHRYETTTKSYLRKFPLDKIKIDRSFVRDVAHVASAAAVARAILGLARDLGFDSIAEGVETVGQYRLLQKWGCGEMQGFLFSPAVPPDEIGALLLRRFDARDAAALAARRLEAITA